MREYILVFLVAAAVTYLLTVVAREIAIRSGAVAKVRDRDVHDEPIPYLGGLAMLGGLVAAYLVARQLPFLSDANPFVFRDAGIVLVAGGMMCALGVLDDLLELDALTKLAGQVLAAGFLVAALAGIRRVPVVAAHWLMIGVATLLAAAVGFEALGGLVLSSIGDGSAYILLSHLEEFGETCAAAMLLAAAVSAVSVQQGGASGSLEFAYLDRSALGQQRS